MKKLLLPAVALMMASCGGVDVCSCKKGKEELMAKMNDAKDDDARKAIEEEYKEQEEACKKWGEDQLKDLSDDEKRAKMEEWAKEVDIMKV